MQKTDRQYIIKSPHQQRVEHFMMLARQAVPSVPYIPTVEIRKLRASLIMEEALETVRALGFDVYSTGHNDYVGPASFALEPDREPDIVEVADGCADVSVVTIGTLSAFGICDEPLLAAVDISNLDKFGPGSYKSDLGKWIKPPDWTPPPIKDILDKQGYFSV